MFYSSFVYSIVAKNVNLFRMLKLVNLDSLSPCFSADGVADVVLSCTLVEEGMGGGTSLTRTPATLILRDVPVPSDESLETLTPFVPTSIPDPDAILLEVKGRPRLLYIYGSVYHISKSLC